MDWPDDVLDERTSAIAGAVLTLLSDPLRWRHRRVETITLSAFAALSGLVLRVESHPLVRALLGRSRIALGCTALSLVVAAAPIGLGLDRTAIMVCWGVGAILALGALGVLVDDMIDHTPIGRRLSLSRSVRRADHTD